MCVYACVCMCVRVHARECVCVRARECVCVCLCARDRLGVKYFEKYLNTNTLKYQIQSTNTFCMCTMYLSTQSREAE